MSPDEVVVLLMSTMVALTTWGMWVRQPITFPARAELGRPTGVLRLAPLVSAIVLFVILKTLSSFDVQDSPIYLTFYMVMGAAWVGLATQLTPLAGVSRRDDVLERRNPAAAVALAGAILGITLSFAGGNIGDGPGWWVVVFSAAIATGTLYLTWLAHDNLTGVGDVVTVERDLAAGVRLAGFLVATGMILGRAVAGDWVSVPATLRDFVVAAWPVLVLLGVAVLVERMARPSPERPALPVGTYGFLPALAYEIATVLYIASIGIET
ncbi:MAG TPA: hypothetical protein VJ596_12620 [Gemmatimonadaceae bacterium]|nr:hypothetical protein [Gemmatimonadaceae bacterium]